MIFVAVVIGVVVLGLIFLFNSFGVVQPNQKGVKVTLGIASEKEVEGWYFVFWPFQKMVRITKELMMFKFTVPSTVTRRGKVEGQDNIVESAEIDIKCTIYARFDDEKLSEIIQYSPGYNAKKLGPFLVPYAIDTVRAMAGRLPWRLINRERFKSSIWVQTRLTGGHYHGIDDDDPKEPIKFKASCDSEIFLDEVNAKSPFATIPMKNVSFVIEDLIFSPSFRESITAAERANLDADAKIIAAQAEKTRKAKEGEGDAAARKAMIEAIKTDKDLETISALKEIGKGQGHFIFALPDAVQKLLNKIGR